MSGARSYHHGALSEVFDRSFDDVYEYAHALTGDHATAAAAVETAYRRLLDRLRDFAADGVAMTALAIALAGDAVRRMPRSAFEGRGIREAISRLPAAEHEAITLRLVAGLDVDVIAAATGRRPPSLLGSEAAALRTLRGAKAGFSFALPAAHRQLDGALDRLLDGEPAAEAARSAPAVPEASRVLSAAANLVGLPAEPSPPATRARIRNQFLAGGEERRAQWVHQHQAPAIVPGRRPRQRANPIGTTAALVLAALLAVIAGAVLAFAANFSTPSSPVYPLKRADESLLVGLTFNRVAKANLEVKLSEERMREAETEAATRHGDATVEAVADRFDLLRAAAIDLAAMPRRDADWKRARDAYVQQASQPMDPLARLLASNGMQPESQDVTRLNQRFQDDRKTLDGRLGAPNPTQPGTVPSGAPNATPPPPTQ